MAKCAECGKGPSFGNTRSFAMNRGNRRFNPNLQTVTVVKNDKPQKVKMCTRCMRTASKLR